MYPKLDHSLYDSEGNDLAPHPHCKELSQVHMLVLFLMKGKSDRYATVVVTAFIAKKSDWLLCSDFHHP